MASLSPKELKGHKEMCADKLGITIDLDSTPKDEQQHPYCACKVLQHSTWGNKLNLKIQINQHDEFHNHCYESNYDIRGLDFAVHIRLVQETKDFGYKSFLHLIHCKGVSKEEGITYKYKVLSKVATDKIQKSYELNADDVWYLHSLEDSQETFILELKVTLINIVTIPFFGSLHTDTELCDFKMTAKGGSVFMHKVVLAVASPVLKTMLSGQWREASENKVCVPNASIKTLQCLKDYIYLQKFADTEDMETTISLLELATYYMMPELELKCAHKIKEAINEENVWDVMEATVKFKSKQ